MARLECYATGYGKNCIKNRVDKIHLLWRKVKNIRHHIVHYTLCNLLLKNFKVILLPSFETQNMVAKKENRVFGKKTARELLTWSHYEFQQCLLWKAKLHGPRRNKVVIVSEAYTTKTCGYCGEINNSVGGSEVFNCGSCGFKSDRDLNAARNILIKNMGFCDAALKEIDGFN